MSEYSAQEQAAYDFGFKLGRELGATSIEFDAISKKKWISAYQHQIDELIKENEQLREQLAAERNIAEKAATRAELAQLHLNIANEAQMRAHQVAEDAQKQLAAERELCSEKLRQPDGRLHMELVSETVEWLRDYVADCEPDSKSALRARELADALVARVRCGGAGRAFSSDICLRKQTVLT